MKCMYKKINSKCIISKEELTYKLLLILFFFSFIYSNTIRVIIKVQTNIDVRFSVLSMIILILLMYANSRKIKVINSYIFILIAAIQICNTIYSNINMTSNYAFINTIWLPLILICIEIDRDIIFKIFKTIIRIYNILIIILTIAIVIDYLTNGSLQLFMSNFLDGTTYQRVIRFEQSSGVYRSHTLLGHSLTTAYYYLIFLGINMIYIDYFKQNSNLSKNTVSAISVIGLLLSNSKFALILSTILILLNMKNSKRKVFYIYGIIIIVFILINTEYFKENIIARFIQVIELGDLTNGRLTALNVFLESNNQFNLFFGHGMWSSDNLLAYLGTNNFEMPILMFAYDYGILATISILYLIFIYPNIVFIKNKRYYIGLIFNVLFIFGNSYNGFAVGLTTFQMYIFITFILINISKIKHSNDTLKIYEYNLT